MKRLQTSILAIVLVVATCAMAFTALRTASRLWYSALYTFTAFVLLFAVLVARFRRGPERSFWFGFAVFGWAFFLMGLGPWMNPFVESDGMPGGGLNPNLLTSEVILFLVPYLRKDANDLEAINAITENTMGIAHLLITLILAVVGGIIATLLRRRPRRTTSIKSLAILAGLALIGSVATSSYSASAGRARSRDDWLSKVWGEPSLQLLSQRDRDATVFRLLWSPSFHHPVCVRIVRAGEGAQLRAKVLDGFGGYKRGQIAIDRSIVLDVEQQKELDRHLEKAAFWDMPTEIKLDGGLDDGDSLTLEGVKGGSYHKVYRPIPDRSFESLCRYMLGLTQIEMTEAWSSYHAEAPSGGSE